MARTQRTTTPMNERMKAFVKKQERGRIAPVERRGKLPKGTPGNPGKGGKIIKKLNPKDFGIGAKRM